MSVHQDGLIGHVPTTSERFVTVDWREYPAPQPREFEAVLCPEGEGGFSVFALNYPGVISQGETEEEAEANIAEAFLALLESKEKHGEKMEFSQRPTVGRTAGCQAIRVIVDG